MLTKLIAICAIVHHINSLPPILTKSGVLTNQEVLHQNGGNQDAAAKLESAGFDAANGYKKGSENKHTKAEDAGKYLEESADKKQHLDQSDYRDKKFHQKEGGTVSDIGNQSVRKKGQHKSGFHNTYNKDESGSNSSYYDDSDENGGEYVRDSQKGTYGDVSARNKQGSNFDGSYKAQQDGKHGDYNKGGHYNRNVADSQAYNQENDYNNYENRAKANRGTDRGLSKEYYENQYYQQPNYYYENPQYYSNPYYEKTDYLPNYYNPGYTSNYNYPTKKTITIYEDPRYFEQSAQYNNYEKFPKSDSVQLNVQPPLHSPVRDYHDSIKPVYEYY